MKADDTSECITRLDIGNCFDGRLARLYRGGWKEVESEGVWITEPLKGKGRIGLTENILDGYEFIGKGSVICEIELESVH
jgi:hypothetical protein